MFLLGSHIFRMHRESMQGFVDYADSFPNQMNRVDMSAKCEVMPLKHWTLGTKQDEFRRLVSKERF